ncbi:hypothetical protein DFA_07759 [Cavenderia fasciculata]|uniref:Uncharacterized protein n=1 Tax=Cavenderia fasciculata TaxID=261658 RepID=F4Q359_CACFS|nr:uncharacterized protein DFA_07759 [Cavenderia fasciculata]EGG16781.1 hypothetical protein DFA_07759 [Cavenderia fasciculata]|eukprot:XP_004355255.1 hypothetical protein DFA_07759 [Cavenderia fasciculata]
MSYNPKVQGWSISSFTLNVVVVGGFTHSSDSIIFDGQSNFEQSLYDLLSISLTQSFVMIKGVTVSGTSRQIEHSLSPLFDLKVELMGG